MTGGPVAVVVGGGDRPSDDVARRMVARLGPASGWHVVAADHGLEHAESMGWPVAAVVGDLDSVDPAALARAAPAGVRVDAHPVDKAATDLELAMAAAVDSGAEHLVVTAVEGGRADHHLGNLLLLGSDRWRTVRVEAELETALVVVVRGRRQLPAAPGAVVSLFAVGGPAVVTAEGFRWPLRDAVLDPGSTWGVSNVVTAAPPIVTVPTGTAIAVVDAAT